MPSQIQTAPASNPPEVMLIQLPAVVAFPIVLYAPGTHTKSEEVISNKEIPLKFMLWACKVIQPNNPVSIVKSSLVKSYSLENEDMTNKCKNDIN